MSYLWIRFSLLYAATILQSSASNEGLVSLKCNDTVVVVAGENVTLYCSIINRTGRNCTGQQYQWRNSHGKIQCNSGLMKYICDWDNLTYVYLTISNVIKEENYNVTISTDCGFPKLSAIKVRVQLPHKGLPDEDLKATKPPLTHRHVKSAVLGIFVTLAVVGILCFLFGTNRGRQIISRMTKKRLKEDTDTAQRKENLLNP